VHHGQTDGATVHLPVFLGRFPSAPVDHELAAFYAALLGVLADPTFHRGDWQLCERSGWPGDDTFEDLVAWCWEGDRRWLVVVNLADRVASGHVRAPWDDLRGQPVRLIDPTHDVAFDRSGDDLCDGLYVHLDPWDWHLFRVELEEGT
jgi:hypothetical protein